MDLIDFIVIAIGIILTVLYTMDFIIHLVEEDEEHNFNINAIFIILGILIIIFGYAY
jgi:uncharacterized membrane protein